MKRWSPWSRCKGKYDEGIQIRTRKCKAKGCPQKERKKACKKREADTKETRKCTKSV